MKCPRCAREAPASASFCPECGSTLTICARCGTTNEPGYRFCTTCGHSLGEAAARPLNDSRPVSTESRIPGHLVEKILRSKSALEGERKQVTVLFADLKDSMALVADRDVEEARQVLDRVVQDMMEAVHRYEGTVNLVMGDGIMALFGAPVAHEDHAVRACYAALHVQETARRRSAAQQGVGADTLIRIGLNSGEVVVRSIRSDLRMDYTAIGQTTHIASRLEQAATPGAIFISSETLKLAEGFVETWPIGPVALKGVARPTSVYQLIAARPPRSRFQVPAARGLTAFVGRSAEVEALKQALERIASGGGGEVVAVVGEPGVGKSRLLWEFVHARPAVAPLVLESGCLSYAETTPYLPVVELLRGCFEVDADEDARDATQKIKRQLEALDLSESTALPPLMWLLDLRIEDEGWYRLDPTERRHRTLETVKDVLVRASRRRPLVVIVEDLQWADSETRAVLDVLVDHLPESRLLLLVTYRPGYEDGWSNRPEYRRIEIDQLTKEASQALLDTLVGPDPGLGGLKHTLVDRTAGNPFFLEESVRTLVESAVLTGRPGDYRVGADTGPIQVPASVRAVLAARIDRLTGEQKRLLQAASVIGMDVPLTLLEAVAEISGDDLRTALDRLDGAGFLGETRLYPDIEYSFEHALTREVAYETLVRDRRRSLHASIVAAIERLYPTRLAEYVERLAHHSVSGEVWPKAVVYCREAGYRSMARSANQAAATHFERGLEAVEHLGETREALQAAIDLRLDLRSALNSLGEHGKIAEVLTAAARLADRLGDSRRLGLVVSFLSNLLAVRGEFDQALEHGQRALEIAGKLGDLPLRIVTNAHLAIIHWARGEYRLAVDRGGQNVPLLAGDQRFERFGMALLPSVYSRTAMILSLAELGDFDECARLGTEALGIAEASEHPQSLISACFGLGTARMRRGDFDGAIAMLERGQSIAKRMALNGPFLELTPPLASAYALSGRPAQALALVEEAVALAIALRNRLGHWIRSGGLAEAYLSAGRVDEARPMAQLYVEVTRAVKARGNEGWALRLLGDVLAHDATADPSDAERTLTEALELAREFGMRPLEGRCNLTFGILYRRTGAMDTARSSLAAAARMFETLGMPTWQARADAAVADDAHSL